MHAAMGGGKILTLFLLGFTPTQNLISQEFSLSLQVDIHLLESSEALFIQEKKYSMNILT